MCVLNYPLGFPSLLRYLAKFAEDCWWGRNTCIPQGHVTNIHTELIFLLDTVLFWTCSNICTAVRWGIQLFQWINVINEERCFHCIHKMCTIHPRFLLHIIILVCYGSSEKLTNSFRALIVRGSNKNNFSYYNYILSFWERERDTRIVMTV